MTAVIQCRSCHCEHPATEILRRCACGGKSYRILYRNDPPPTAHSYLDSAGTLRFTDKDAE